MVRRLTVNGEIQATKRQISSRAQMVPVGKASLER
jgi:hypothetical protein